ncbi:MAG TPA: cytochrome c [Vicinamibacterales bacterium]|nr:cytochrome c [Vicinamibacterales bacterium]
MIKRWQKTIFSTVLVLGALFLTGITATIGWRPFIGPKTRPLTDRRFEPTPARLERGAYLVRNVAGCLFCHSDLDPSVDGLPVKAGRDGAGRPFTAEDMPWLTAPNLTSDQETGAATWTDDMLARAIREGIGHDGRALFPLMPYMNYRRMADEDLAAVITYIRSLPPVRQTHSKTALPFPMSRLINAVPQPLDNPVAPPDVTTPAKRGEYLATLASCADCHTPMDDRGQFVPGMAFAGGSSFKYGDARAKRAAANLTPAPNGIPYYNEELFLEAIRTGRVRDRQISDVMPWGHYRNMTDEDLRAIFAYLKTLEPVNHYVDNALPPALCAKCNLLHGGGARNTKAE